MKTNSDKILRYIAENMSDDEKRRFEKELEESPQLKRQFEKTMAELNRFKKVGNIEANDTYFNNLIPRVVSRVEKKKKRGFVLGFSFGGAISAVMVLFIFVWGGSPSTQMFTDDYNKMIADVATDIEYSDVENYYGYEDLYSYSSLDYALTENNDNAELLDEFFEEYGASYYNTSENGFGGDIPVIDDIIDYEGIPEENIDELYKELEDFNIL